MVAVTATGPGAGTVLVVEDEPAIAELIRTYLERERFAVRVVGDGVTALDAVRRGRPSVVVLDVGLPGMDGTDVCRRMREGGDWTPVLFVTAGSGITPVMGMLRTHLADLDDVVVVHSAPTPGDVIFGAELRGHAAAGRLRLVERHTDAEGMLVPSDLDTLVPDWRTRQTWACGPTGMLEVFEGHWADGGLADVLHTERFRATVVVAGDGGTVTFSTSGRTVDADGGTPILDAGEGAGVVMPSGCRMGICFGCVVPLRTGAVRDLRNGALTTAIDPADGIRIQTCVSAAAGACEIDL